MGLNFKNAEEFLKYYKENPLKALLILLIVVACIAVSAWLSGYFNQVGKNQANIAPPASQSIPKKSDEQIEQTTSGDQSPAVISDGDVKIVFEKKK